MKNKLIILIIGCLTFYSCNLLNSLINENKSSEARLKSVDVSLGNIDFNEDTYEYKLSFNNSVKQIDIIPSLKDEKAKIYYNNTLVTNKSPINVALSVGDNIVSLSIIAENGFSKPYVFTINRSEAIFSEITSFSVNEIVSDITGDKITLELPYGTDLTSLSPKIELSNQGSYSPLGNVDFTNTVTYTTKSSDGSEKVYYVDIKTALPPTDSNSKNPTENNGSTTIPKAILSEITSFSINNINSDIIDDKITLELPYGTDLTSLSPNVELTNEGSYSPLGNVDFTNTVTFTTKSSDGSEKVYYVDVKTTLPSTDSSLKELIINGESIPLQSGIFNYQYLYNSTNTSTSTLPVSMSSTNNNAEILEGNISSITIKNPDPGVLSEATLFNVKVKAQNGDISTYNITVSSAIVWATVNVTFPCSNEELIGKQLKVTIGKPNSTDIIHNINLRGANKQQIAIPGLEETNFISNWTSIEIDEDNSNDFNFGDYFHDYFDIPITFSKTQVFKFPDAIMKKANRVKVINLPVNYKDKDRLILFKSTNTREFISWSYLFDETSETYIGTLTGDFILSIFTRTSKWTEFGNEWFEDKIFYADDKFIDLGSYTITEESDITIDASGLPIKEYKELGPAIVSFDLNTGIIVFSEAMDTLSVEEAFDMINVAGGHINVNFTWNESKTQTTITPTSPLDLSTNYKMTISKNAKGASGVHMFNEAIVYN